MLYTAGTLAGQGASSPLLYRTAERYRTRARALGPAATASNPLPPIHRTPGGERTGAMRRQRRSCPSVQPGACGARSSRRRHVGTTRRGAAAAPQTATTPDERAHRVSSARRRVERAYRSVRVAVRVHAHRVWGLPRPVASTPTATSRAGRPRARSGGRSVASRRGWWTSTIRTWRERRRASSSCDGAGRRVRGTGSSPAISRIPRRLPRRGGAGGCTPATWSARAPTTCCTVVDRRRNIIRRSGENIAAAEWSDAAGARRGRSGRRGGRRLTSCARSSHAWRVAHAGVTADRALAERLTDCGRERLAYFKARAGSFSCRRCRRREPRRCRGASSRAATPAGAPRRHRPARPQEAPVTEPARGPRWAPNPVPVSAWSSRRVPAREARPAKITRRTQKRCRSSRRLHSLPTTPSCSPRSMPTSTTPRTPRCTPTVQRSRLRGFLGIEPSRMR